MHFLRHIPLNVCLRRRETSKEYGQYRRTYQSCIDGRLCLSQEDKDVVKGQAIVACSPQGGVCEEECGRLVKNRPVGTVGTGMERLSLMDRFDDGVIAGGAAPMPRRVVVKSSNSKKDRIGEHLSLF
ncbi:hypothetical protein BLNAU_5305 [Blattamonas nauphoetae]|nr:hypothetical protein BLNAU_5305 [Blattamonas nauphoetae]